MTYDELIARALPHRRKCVAVTIRGLRCTVTEVEFDPKRRRELEVEEIERIVIRGLKQTAEQFAAIHPEPRAPEPKPGGCAVERVYVAVFTSRGERYTFRRLEQPGTP